MLVTDGFVAGAVAATPSLLVSTFARPPPYTMYTPPVPPVTMSTGFPAKFGVGEAAAGAPDVAPPRGAGAAGAGAPDASSPPPSGHARPPSRRAGEGAAAGGPGRLWRRTRDT